MRSAIFIAAAVTVLFAAAFANVNQPGEATISFAGDIMLSRDVGVVIEKYGYDYPYSQVRDIFLNDDLTVANLECPLTRSEQPVYKDKRILFKAEPENAAALKEAGLDVLNLANNHTMDQHAEGLADTMDALTESGLIYIGSSYGEELQEPFYININGVELGFLAYTCLPPEGFFHIDGEPTVMYARIGHMDKALEQIGQAADNCDFLIVYYHWGDEYVNKSTPSQRETARAAIDAGAGLVVGTHPHVTQETEEYNGGLIYYSLGNFVFDRQAPPNTDKGLILQVTVTKKGILNVTEMPVTIINGAPMQDYTPVKKNLPTNFS